MRERERGEREGERELYDVLGTTVHNGGSRERERERERESFIRERERERELY